ncbi:MAG: metallophosphoesterase family protein [Owenweeksia sp.]
MIRISLLSDTHSYIDEKILELCDGSDEIWHAGDIGSLAVTNALEKVAPVKAVYGNIDDHTIRAHWPEHNRFMAEKVDVWITHIGGYPGRYSFHVKPAIYQKPPKLFICGHSHILKVMNDKRNGLLYMNPGAIGKHGFHKVRTMLRFSIDSDRIKDLEVVELPR